MAWLISNALMNSLYLQEPVEESLLENFLDGEQSVLLSGSRTQQAYCAPDKMTAFSRLSRFGMTYKPLTESRGEELLTLFREGFHAKTLAQQEEAQELTESEAGCGEKWRASFTKYDPDSRLWKTHQCSLLGGLEPFLETWPQCGFMRDGECWEQQMLEQTIRGTESGLSENKKLWPTPCLPGNGGTNGKAKMQKMLAEKWPTPTAHMSKETNAPSEHNRNTPTLTAQANWPTPRSCSAMSATLTDKGKRFPNLETVMAHSDKTTIGGKLNPMWVEWLMGWPLGWTDLKPLEMDKSHCVQQQHGESLEVNNG